MSEAKISEIFVSYQGEGPYLGVKQLFIRFYGCSFGCAYCDTKLLRYGTFTKEDLLGKIAEYREPYHSVSITGGEPLEQSDFLKEFLVFWKADFFRRDNSQKEPGQPVCLPYQGLIDPPLVPVGVLNVNPAVFSV